MNKIAVIGAGSWGSALSAVLADNGHAVSLYCRRHEQMMEINDRHTNERYLPNVRLPEHIQADTSLEHVVRDAQVILVVLPTVTIRSVLKELVPFITGKPLFIHSSKGLEVHTYKRISEMIAEEIPKSKRNGIVVLSGPSHAEEVIRRSPTTVVAAADKIQLAEQGQELFMSNSFRVYTNLDVVGVELGGALKNIIALGAGLSDGLGYGDNAKAALVTRGLAEITRLSKSMGANTLTLSGLAGIGDLVVTCTSKHSRNWRMGYALGQGKSVEHALHEMGMVVEGVQTAKAAYQMARKKDVQMPITKELYAVLFENKSARKAVNDLMGRGKTHEHHSF